MALFDQHKRICSRTFWPLPVAGHDNGVGIIAIAILVFITLISIF